MSKFIINGGIKLSGEITPQGAKNEALQIICATLLTNEPVEIINCPDIKDVTSLIDILINLGVNVEKKGKGNYIFQAKELNLAYLKSKEFKSHGGSLRGSILMMGPILTRFGSAYMTRPGGDRIGRRRLDTHFHGFIKLGAKFNFNEDESFFSLEATNGKLKGTYLLLDEASVTGTSNIIMAAVLAEGTTTVYNAACEPYVQQLCKMLNAMGAKITGIGSNLLTINGVKSLKGCKHKILPDMIEVGSWIGLAAMTRSSITIKNVDWESLGIIPRVFEQLGIIIEKKENNDLFIPEQKKYKIQKFIDGSILTISDAPWPGFTPDLISIVLVIATQAKGSVLIHQKMFESRLFFVDKLIEMGAQIILCDPHRATVIGMNHEISLRATTMSSPDIRAGVSLLIAALSAKGKSTIYNIEQIDRGYENIDERLRAIGAQIERVE
ncbi:MAG: UDP-N-acetylglucosamine 1-carboxyvinyltransferase [Solirubrobacteraceae bacterium]